MAKVYDAALMVMDQSDLADGSGTCDVKWFCKDVKGLGPTRAESFIREVTGSSA